MTKRVVMRKVSLHVSESHEKRNFEEKTLILTSGAYYVARSSPLVQAAAPRKTYVYFLFF